MTDELEQRIDEAAAALRETTGAPASERDAARTRARILETHRRERDRSSRAAVWLAAAAALMVVLGGSTAWAYWTGRLDGWIGGASETHETPAPTAVVDEPVHAPRPTALAPEPEAPAPTAVSEIEMPAPTPVGPSDEAVPADVDRARTPIADETPETPPSPTALPVDPRERAAYRAAHALHFEQHDAAGAIGAWDAYLAEYPRGRFALEARYNRALCLVRVGRTSEAREALAPFVAGTHGGYRQHEATELVQAIDAQ
jgi:TolA-binding protein